MLFGGRWERNGQTDRQMCIIHGELKMDQLVLESHRSTDRRTTCVHRWNQQATRDVDAQVYRDVDAEVPVHLH